MAGLGFFETGEFYSLLCAVLWAVSVILFRKSGDHMSPLVLNVFKSTVGLALFLATLWVVGVDFFPDDRTGTHWLVVLSSGVVGIGLADTI
ncbi:MAG: EamA family transporter, partial [Deltaproteobacteria bacterium]|nr:EamA family transporter [Deltaproteobacteria bacterium]